MDQRFSFQADISPEAEMEISRRLDLIEEDNGIKFIFAIESGSRAWGFPSPDSDYDVRFVYVRRPDAYLSVFPSRDVIETPLTADWDMNGWDISKALSLLLKPNPVLLEWMASPIRYRWDAEACDRLTRFAQQTVKPAECLNHYYHLLLSHLNRHFGDAETVKLKKYFYVLRPAMAIRWIRMNPDTLPPMNFQRLINGTEVPDDTCDAISALLRAKAGASELGVGARVKSIDDLIESERLWAKDHLIKKAAPSADVMKQTDHLFRDLVKASL